ncbi:hypothetical protein SAMN04487911_1458 [Arenibacter nanhaiticus]|uniref:Uncharacterized protein n=1 Tax=Arenibacter nanhaiticus TaxID=558155 RepID=A0A1M6MP34_9FLAO|nr:hypothetical protein SAMN04487911_1458 [Arenibacter nanhaiticus]
MDLMVELFFRGLIVNFFGRNARYLFYKIIGKPKSIEYLTADKTKDNYEALSQHILNVIVGLIVFIGLSFLGAYLVYSEVIGLI